MKTCTLYLTSWLLAGVLLLSNHSYATVDIIINQQTFQYSHSPRLDEVLAPVALQQHWYWPGAKLYRLDNPAIEQQRQQLLELLLQLQQQAPTELQAELFALQQQLASWRLGQRVFIPIDYDLARAQQAFNPAFEPGRYKLQLQQRPDTLLFWGALQRPLTLEHLGGAAISAYLNALPRSAVADKSWAVIIQPDGTVVNTGVAAWNHQHLEAMPGAQVFIPFAAGHFNTDFTLLNTKLLALALHRIEQ